MNQGYNQMNSVAMLLSLKAYITSELKLLRKGFGTPCPFAAEATQNANFIARPTSSVASVAIWFRSRATAQLRVNVLFDIPTN